MTLYSYQQTVQQLLSDMKQELVNPAMLVTFINIARRQLAGESNCLRVLGTISTTVAQRNYNFSSVSLGTSSVTGVSSVLNVRAMRYAVASGYQWVRPRPWPWFDLFCMNNPVPASGAPARWAQYAQGSTGSFYLDPIPDLIYVLTLDCTCYPINLVDDTTVEAIPPLWTDAVAFFAAHLAYLNAQKMDSSKNMLDMYQMFLKRARSAANPAVNTYLYEQAADPTQINKIGVQKSVGG